MLFSIILHNAKSLSYTMKCCVPRHKLIKKKGKILNLLFQRIVNYKLINQVVKSNDISLLPSFLIELNTIRKKHRLFFP